MVGFCALGYCTVCLLSFGILLQIGLGEVLRGVKVVVDPSPSHLHFVGFLTSLYRTCPAAIYYHASRVSTRYQRILSCTRRFGETVSGSLAGLALALAFVRVGAPGSSCPFTSNTKHTPITHLRRHSHEPMRATFMCLTYQRDCWWEGRPPQPRITKLVIIKEKTVEGWDEGGLEGSLV